MIRDCLNSDVTDLCRIYNYYILNDICTFETTVLSSDEFNHRISKYTKNNPWIVYEANSRVIGYAYARQWHQRAAYINTKEVSIYIDNECRSGGIGYQLYSNLINRLKNNSHVLIAGITLPNNASVSFHERFNFEKVAHFKEVGYKFNRWLDVGYWQLTL